jgi:hydrogenase nickel incorporation protein HypA/HybF
MHELPITESILRTAIDAAKRGGASRITAIDLVIGCLSSIADESVQVYFIALSRGTIAEGASLRFRREPAMITCFSCSYTAPIKPPLPSGCPVCGSSQVRVHGGHEFLVESVDVDRLDPEM